MPLPDGARLDTGQLDVRVIADRLGMPLVHDAEHGLWALSAPRRRSRRSGADDRARPRPRAPRRDGTPFQLSSLRGQKVMLVAWASW